MLVLLDPLSFFCIFLFLILFAVIIVIITRYFSKTPFTRKTFETIWQVEKVVLETTDFEEATQNVVNAIFSQLGNIKLGSEVITLTLLDEQNQQLKRIAISRTEAASKFLKASPIPFQDIVIPLASKENLSVRAITEKRMFTTPNVADVLYPALSREWVASFQSKLGIKTSIVYPVMAKEHVMGAIIFSLSKEKTKIKESEWSVLNAFVAAVGIALDNALLFKRSNETSAALKDANIRLKQLDKLKDDFVSIASHELRTPMTAIKSYLWMALNKKKQEIGPDLARYLNNAYVSVDRLISLVNDMLNVSRIEEGRISLILKPTDLIKLSDFVVDEVLPKAMEKQIKVIVNEAQIPQVMCDEDKIHEVLLNLLGNSLKFTPQGGAITISFSRNNELLATTVTDTGAGISSADLPRLFSKFGRLANSYVAMAESSGGTGLGLYISKSLVELQKGTITAASPGLGKGSQFTFTLPIVGTALADQLVKETPPPSPEAKALEHTTIRI